MKEQELKVLEFKQINAYLLLLDKLLDDCLAYPEVYIGKNFIDYGNSVVDKPIAKLALKKLSNDTIRLNLTGDKSLSKASDYDIFNYSRVSVSIVNVIDRVYSDVKHHATYVL